MRGAFLVDIDLIIPDPTQPRRAFAKDKLEELIASVRERGIRQPIRVRFDDATGLYRIIAGERRFRAAKAASLSQVPCLLVDAASTNTREVLIEQVVENWQRADLEPVELSNALTRLRDDEHMTQEEIARVTGKPASEISRLLSIQKVDADILAEAQKDKRLSRRALVALATVEKEEQHKLAAQVRSGHLNALEVEQEARRVKNRKQGNYATAGRGALRRFVVGTATVEVQFRKREADPSEVAMVLRRAAEMADEEEVK